MEIRIFSGRRQRRMNAVRNMDVRIHGRKRHRFIRWIWPLLLICTAGSGHGYEPTIHDTARQQTIEEFRRLPCLTAEQVAFVGEVLRGFDYNRLRVFRSFCLIPGMDFFRSRRVLGELLKRRLSYEQVLAFEAWSLLTAPGDLEKAIAALNGVATLELDASRAFAAFCRVDGVSAEVALHLVPLLRKLSTARILAARALFEVAAMTASQALDCLHVIGLQGENQSWAAESFFRISGMTSERARDGLTLISKLADDSAWNAKTLFESPGMDADEGWFFLVAYFANTTSVREGQYLKLSDNRKGILLDAFYRAGIRLIYKINNLHAITDRYGFEISSDTLRASSFQRLGKIFAALSPQVRSRFGQRVLTLTRAGRKNELIAVLRRATAADRKQTARDLTAANIYALLAQGGDLYDSSFRDILVPELAGRIDAAFPRGLVAFLQAIDPETHLVSDFIVSLAQKGKLTVFFPDDPREQEQVLELVAASAFEDEDSLLLFSATFMHLLETLRPPVRTFLIRRMTTLADGGESLFAKQVRVILQYYLKEYPELLSAEDRGMITGLLAVRGRVDLTPYLTTPFAQWKRDGRLSSLSIFHPDDDGRRSFFSNARILLKSGYLPVPSKRFFSSRLSGKAKERAAWLVKLARKKPGSGLPKLYREMVAQHFAVDFVRKKEGITINHTVFIYSNQQDQERLLQEFIVKGHEMFAQRGHSYWRKEQIIEPLEKLLATGRITEQDLLRNRRFLSLGSCGGIKVYSRLSELFRGNVDILATIGTGKAGINDPYNKNFFEVVAAGPDTMSWTEMARKSSFIFARGYGRDYLQPGSLPAILHKMISEEKSGR